MRRGFSLHRSSLITFASLSASAAGAALTLALSASAAAAQQDPLELAKAARNPVGSLISVGFRNHWNFETGDPSGTRSVLNIEPVVPWNVSRSLRLVPHLLVPFEWQNTATDASDVGVGDVGLKVFLSPREERNDGLMFGAGPMMTFATADDETNGAELWSAGVAAAALVAPDSWVVGFEVTQQWSFSATGPDSRPVAPFTLGPFVHYVTPSGWGVFTAPLFTAQWLAGDDAPFMQLGGGVSKVFALLEQHLLADVEAYANPLRTELYPKWTLKASFSLLFPTNEPGAIVRRIERR